MKDLAKVSNGKQKILVVDDETKIVDVVKSYLEHSGYEVITAFNGKRALEMFESHKPDLIVLDLMLPDISGEDVCKTLRKTSNIAIIMLTAKVEEESALLGLGIGADDYITKPFSPKLLIARIAAILRRMSQIDESVSSKLVFDNGNFIIDIEKHEVCKQSNIINLTPNEFKLLSVMVRNPTKVFTREELITFAIGDDFDGFDRTIDTHIKNLRHKLEEDPRKPKYILTVHGLGYRFNGRS